MKNFHDHEIVKYEINLKENLITIFTQYKKNNCVFDFKVIFSDVLVHYFQNELPGSFILELEKHNIECFMKDNIELLIKSKIYLWPINFNTLEELEVYLTEQKYKYYNIMSSYGLCGWVLSKNIHIQ